MRKIICTLLLVSLLALCLTACGGGETPDTTAKVDFTTPASDTVNFVYDGTKLVGLTDAGKAKESLTIPADATALAADVLKTSSALKTLIIGERTTVVNLDNGAFNGTANLKVYIGCAVDYVTCGEELAKGATGLTFNVVAAQYANFKEHYTWGKFADQIKKYE